MIPTADPDACLGPGYRTVEFASFSGDRRPTCASMNMALLLLGKSWLQICIIWIHFQQKISSFFWHHDSPPAFWSSLHLFFRFPRFFESPIPPQSLYRCSWERPARLVALAILRSFQDRYSILPWSSQAACGSGSSFLPFILSILCSCAPLSGLRHMYKCDTGQIITSNNAGARWSHWMPALPLFAARLFHRPALRLTRVSADLGLRGSRIY